MTGVDVHHNSLLDEMHPNDDLAVVGVPQKPAPHAYQRFPGDFNMSSLDPIGVGLIGEPAADKFVNGLDLWAGMGSGS